jgi:hypothetical protein
MNEYHLPWLLRDTVLSVEAGEFQRWSFNFRRGGSIIVECPWRLLHDGLIVVSSADHGQQFGLPAPINAAAAVSECLATKAVTAINIAGGTADLTIHFGSTDKLEIIALSSGYEAWQSISPSGFQVIAQGQGQLSGFKR